MYKTNSALAKYARHRRGTTFWSQKYRNYRRLDGKIQDTYRTIFKALKIQAEIVILQEIQESVPRLQTCPADFC